MAGVDFPPPHYSSIFLQLVIKAAAEQGIDISEILYKPKAKSHKADPAQIDNSFLPRFCDTTPVVSASNDALNVTDRPEGRKKLGSSLSKLSAKKWRCFTSKFVFGLSDKHKKAKRDAVVEGSGCGGRSRDDNYLNMVVPTSNNNRSEKSSSLDDLISAGVSDMSMLQLLAFNALDLTLPASNILLQKRKNSWIQLSGHEGAFGLAGPGTIWKRRTAKDDCEVRAYRAIQEDIISDCVPKFYKEVDWNGDYYIELQDLLQQFDNPSIMDIKMGTRTFLEQEVKNQTPREDLYQKMIKVDRNAPTEDEHRLGAVTKFRYMVFREEQSSTSTLGFRIEALKLPNTPPVKDLKLVRTRADVACTMSLFLTGKDAIRQQLLSRLKSMRDRLEISDFFARNEIVGSSILIIHDNSRAGAWMIDFAKTATLPDNCRSLNHRRPYTQGNREDGYLTGLDNLIQIMDDLKTNYLSQSELNDCVEL